LRVWQKAVDLSVECYGLSKRFPKEETYGLMSQVRRSAVSIAANIAEGHGRKHLGDYLHHLSVAKGSLMELETHLVIAQKLEFVSNRDLESVLRKTDSVSRMLSGLITKLRGSSGPTHTAHRTPHTEK